MKGKDLLKDYDRDKSRMAEYIGQLIGDIDACERSIANSQQKIDELAPDLAELKEMTLEQFNEKHPDKNYTGIFKGKKAGKDLKL